MSGALNRVSHAERHQYQAVGGLCGQVQIRGVVGVEQLQRVSADLLVRVQQQTHAARGRAIDAIKIESKSARSHAKQVDCGGTWRLRRVRWRCRARCVHLHTATRAGVAWMCQHKSRKSKVIARADRPSMHCISAISAVVHTNKPTHAHRFFG